ncbi:MAG: tetratricopeptide repeat protein [Planctomycetes bacterium]|nr:tetratricopeptide repeat protein [Planctomycetota bacterium]
MTSATAPAPDRAAPPTSSPWFRSPSFDFLLILGVPFLTWPLVMAANGAWGPDLMSQLILLTATGHYFATFVRAYGDLDLFARFRVRFVIAPIVLLLTCVGLFVSGYGAQLMIVVTAWAFWHWLAQAFGFARIYDIKVGSYHPRTAFLDKALVVAGFVGTATLTDGAVATFGKLALDAGIPLPAGATVAAAQTVIAAVVVVVAVAYLLNLAVTIARGQPWSWQKQVMHVTTIGYYWFAFAWLPNVLVAHVLYELFHDIQYFAITWITCQGRARRPGVTGWVKRMFRPTWMAAAAFVALMVALGGVDAFGRHSLEQGAMRDVWIGVFLTFALLHYYYDGFIWKAREGALGKDLGIRQGLRAAVVPGLRHGVAWSAFFVPLILVIALGREIPERERLASLAEVAPDDFYSQSMLAMQLTRERQLDEALERYARSVALNPDFGPTHLNYGAALELHGDLDEAERQYQLALQCVDKDRAHVTAHGYLGVLLLARGREAEARPHLEQARQRGGENPLGRMFALAAALPPTALDQREGYYRAAVAFDPDNRDARLMLGMLLVERFRFADARRHLEAFVRAVPNHAPALSALALAQCETGAIDDARRNTAAALRLDPSDARARELSRRLAR